MPFNINVDGTFPDIGGRYDIGIATRDGSNLLCANKNANPVPVSRMAYMMSIDRRPSQFESSGRVKTMREATELQEKDRLTQLGTSTSIDREFDQWVQNTQGDWAGGIGQRVYGQSGIVDQYFDGEGLLWPLNDWVPQVPLPQLPVTAMPAGTLTAPLYKGLAGGFVVGAGNGYAIAYGVVNGANWDTHVRFYYGNTSADVTVVTNGKATPLALFVAHGAIWMIAANLTAGGNVTLYRIGWIAGPALSVIQTVIVVADLKAASTATAIITAALLGNRMYVAVALAYPPAAGFTNQVTVYDFTTGPAVAPFANQLPFPSDTNVKMNDLNFQGGQLYVSLSDGFNSSIVASPPPFASTGTVAVLPGLASTYLCTVGSTLFLVAWSQASTGQINRIDLYILDSGGLTEIGPLSLPRGLTPLSVSSPLAFDGYAIWSMVCSQTGSAVRSVVVYAFDVPRTRLFRALTVSKAGFTSATDLAHEALAVIGATNRSIVIGGNTGTYLAQWGLVVYTENLTNQTEFAEEFYFGVLPLTPAPTFSGLLQLGVDIISGLFDFTAATNKLFRAAVSHFIGGLIPGQAAPAVTLKTWFDQDPNRLSTVPDFTSNTGVAPNPLPSQLDLNLFTNRVARKLVYQVTSTGGGFVNNVWVNAPKITDVIVQAATGWVWDMALDLSPTVGVNGQGQQEYAYTAQSPTDATSLSYDHVVAYNFLKKLWREKGGECQLYLPNGDSYPALIQLLAFESPKPIAGIGRSDVESTWQVFALIKIREDI